MNEIDVNREWLRLQEMYAAMADDELQLIADDAYAGHHVLIVGGSPCSREGTSGSCPH